MSTSSRARRRIRIMVWGAVGGFLVLLALASAYLVWNARAKAQADSAAQAQRYVGSAQAALNRALLSVDVLLAGVDELLGLSASMPQWIEASPANQRLASAERQNLMVRYLAILDEQGQVLASSNPTDAPSTLNMPPGFLQDVLTQPVSSMVLSAPTISPTSAERVIYLARYARVANGARLVVVAEVLTSTLTTVLVQGVDIAGLEVTLERGQGQLLLGVPSQDAVPERLLVPALQSLPAAQDARAMPARLSGQPALVVARAALYRDLWITASIPLDSALAPWRSERNTVLGATALLGIMVLLAGGFAATYFTRMMDARAAIASSQATLDQAMASMVSGFLLLDDQRRVVRWNRRYVEMFTWTDGHIRPLMPFSELLHMGARRHFTDGSQVDVQAWVARRLAQLEQPSAAPHELVTPEGQCIQITDRATPDGGRVITYHDVTDLRRASAEIETLAFYDPLTSLPNRRLLLDRLGQATTAAARSGQMGALLFLDLDRFKQVNDTLGHEVGDDLLRQVAQRLKSCVRDADTVARLGGDEFVVMLESLSSNPQQAATLAQHLGDKILQAFNQAYVLAGNPYRSTASLGATLFGNTGQSAAELLKQADIAMYQVKALRGNALCFFDPQMQASISHRAQLETDLRSALEHHEFALHYQPQFALDGRMVGAEALLRWQHPQRGMVLPGEFIGVAEERELIIPIGTWVLATACAQLTLWAYDTRSSHLQLAVNVSARQFRQTDFVQQVADVLAASGVKPHLLKLELTESLVLDNVDDSIAKMGQLKALGVQFSVDDFGTGYSSLAYLTRLPLDQLKIDQSFVRNLGVRDSDGLIVQTIIGMARNLGLEVIAEGVETSAQKDYLAAHGCTLFQGYLLARPAPVAALQAMLQA